jgi:hypothetical protein
MSSASSLDDEYEIVSAPHDACQLAETTSHPIEATQHQLAELQADVTALTVKVDCLTQLLAALQHAADIPASVSSNIKPVNAFKLPAPPAVGTTLLHQQNFTIRVGMLLDVLDTKGKWYLSEVLAVTKSMVYVHYLGWAQRWDEWLPMDNHARIQPAYSHTAGVCRPKPGAAIKPTYPYPPPWPRNDSG